VAVLVVVVVLGDIPWMLLRLALGLVHPSVVRLRLHKSERNQHLSVRLRLHTSERKKHLSIRLLRVQSHHIATLSRSAAEAFSAKQPHWLRSMLNPKYACLLLPCHRLPPCHSLLLPCHSLLLPCHRLLSSSSSSQQPFF
jgi:hypothetical protein